VAHLVGRDLGGAIRLEPAIDSDTSDGSVCSGFYSVGTDRASWKRSRLNSLRNRANRCLCNGVIFRRCEGLVFSAHHSSTDHLWGCERSSFDVFGEISCGIGWRS